MRPLAGLLVAIAGAALVAAPAVSAAGPLTLTVSPGIIQLAAPGTTAVSAALTIRVTGDDAGTVSEIGRAHV